MKRAKRMVFTTLCVCALGLCACTQQASIDLEKEQTNLGFLESAEGELVLTLNTEVTMTTVRPDLREELSSEAQAQLQSIHKLVDGHHGYLDETGADIANVFYLNQHVGEGPFAVEQELFDCLGEALVLAELTEGYFNPTVGKLVDVYEGKFAPFETVQENPRAELLEEALATVVPYEELRDHIVLDSAQTTVELVPYHGKDFGLTLGAIGKGYALAYMDLSQDSSYLLSAGASSIRGHVAPLEAETTWNVAVHEPDSTELLLAFRLDEGSVSTSGDDENYYLLEDGSRVSHILNPFTGKSENYWRNVVLVGQDAGVLDALSTALFNIEDKARIVEIVKRAEEHFGFAIDYCFILQEGQQNYQLSGSQGFLDRIIPDYTSSMVDQRMHVF